MANRLRDSVKEQHWRMHMRSWRSNGVSIRSYCLRHQLSEQSFYAWRRELARRDEASGSEPIQRAQSIQQTQSSSLTWMPVTVTSSTMPIVEVHLPTGTVLRVPAEVESQVWERILTALLQANTPPALHQEKTSSVAHQAKVTQESQP